jgi:hypothetical protein
MVPRHLSIEMKPKSGAENWNRERSTRMNHHSMHYDATKRNDMRIQLARPHKN